MGTAPFVTVDVFTDRPFGGNPLAVFPDARGLTEGEMQALAAELNLSETTFVLPPEHPGSTARVRIFNRTAEMPFAGHPMVGTGFVLADRSRDGLLRFEVPAGLVDVQVDHDARGAATGATIAAPQPLRIGGALPPGLVAECAGISPDGIVTVRHPPTLASDGGNPRVLVEVTEAALAAATPDLAAFRRAVAATPELGGLLSLYLYRRDGSRLRTRMFSPLTGTWEDPATGSAATPLAGFLLHRSGAISGAWEILQGVEMGRPSLLRTTAQRTPDGIRARVGGGCVRVLQGHAMLPDKPGP
ncbi:PhzF family phenazine biosynthesis protein [Deinococcus sonorensis]|uniref:PhzF family phenazine biosynthesis protein n=2 Tax=Deinococcus sonorensis TaxID=309891 RepID=A0AAU7U5C4_9DEIO